MADNLRPPADEAEVAAWFRTEALGFANEPSEEFAAAERTVLPVDHMVGVWRGSEPVAVAGWYPFMLTVPGGGRIPVAGLCDVAVLPDARRQGHLRAMVEHVHNQARERGLDAAVLTASAGSIYERFGYGAATLEARWQVDVRTTAPRPPGELRPGGTPLGSSGPGGPGAHSREVVAGCEAAEILAALEARVPARPGALARTPDWWRLVTGPFEHWKGGGRVSTMLLRPPGQIGSDAVVGAAVYRLHPGVDHGVQEWRLEVLDLLASDPEVEAALWEALWELDHVRTIAPRIRPVDEPLRWRLGDPRQLKVTSVVDFCWLCPLDVAALLTSRRYRVEVGITLEVVDAFDPATSGTFRLEGGPAGASCTRVGAGSADLRLSAATLGMLALGGHGAVALADSGRVEERRPGALDSFDAAIVEPRAPFCSTYF